MKTYASFLDLIDAIEAATYFEGQIEVRFEDSFDKVTLDFEGFKHIVERYRNVERERDEIDEKFNALKYRINDTLEDF